MNDEDKAKRFFFRENDEDGYLSNFYPARFIKDGYMFSTSEQCFMYMKAKTFDPNNRVIINKLLGESNPVKAKKLGRHVKNFVESEWIKVRYKIMVDILKCKFIQNKELKRKLLSTSDELLYEASPYDKIWGIGYTKGQACLMESSKFGKNLLGKALMEVRESLS